jgi:hypothetical protein
MRFVGMILIAILVCGTAQAIQIDSRRSAPSDSRQSNALTGQPPSDYQYSGSNFNFSMSRNPTPPNSAAAPGNDADEKAAAEKARPGFFQRLIRDIFGDD